MAITRKEARSRFRGLFTPLMTPFKANYELDLDGLKSNVRYLVKNGFGENDTGVFLVAGAGGEFQVLSTEERKKVAEAVQQETRGRVPAIFGAQHTDPRVVMELCKYAEKVGMEGVQISPPFYDRGQSTDDMIKFYKQVNDATDVGIMVYTSWWHGHTFTREFFSRILEIENVVSVKFSMPSIVEFRDILVRYGDRLAFVDNQQEHITGHKLGEVGFLSHEAHFHVKHQLELWKTMTRGDYTKAVSMLAQVNWPFSGFDQDVATTTGILDALVTKAAIEMIGLASGPVRPPGRSLTPAETASLREILVAGGAPVKQLATSR